MFEVSPALMNVELGLFSTLKMVSFERLREKVNTVFSSEDIELCRVKPHSYIFTYYALSVSSKIIHSLKY